MTPTNRCRRPSTKSARRRRSGAVTVEFALVAPLAFLVTFAGVELARVNMVRNAVTIAALEGARTGSLPGKSASDAQTSANAALGCVGVRSATVTVTPSTITNTTASVTVQVTVPLDQNLWVYPQFFRSRSLTASCTLAREWVNSSTSGS